MIAAGFVAMQAVPLWIMTPQVSFRPMGRGLLSSAMVPLVGLDILQGQRCGA